jgi:hypothetical protein
MTIPNHACYTAPLMEQPRISPIEEKQVSTTQDY